MCAKFLLETVRKMVQRMVPSLAFILFNPAVFSKVLIQLLRCMPFFFFF